MLEFSIKVTCDSQPILADLQALLAAASKLDVDARLQANIPVSVTPQQMRQDPLHPPGLAERLPGSALPENPAPYQSSAAQTQPAAPAQPAPAAAADGVPGPRPRGRPRKDANAGPAAPTETPAQPPAPVAQAQILPPGVTEAPAQPSQQPVQNFPATAMPQAQPVQAAQPSGWTMADIEKIYTDLFPTHSQHLFQFLNSSYWPDNGEPGKPSWVTVPMIPPEHWGRVGNYLAGLRASLAPAAE